MTMNGAVLPILAMYVVAAEEHLPKVEAELKLARFWLRLPPKRATQELQELGLPATTRQPSSRRD